MTHLRRARVARYLVKVNPAAREELEVLPDHVLACVTRKVEATRESIMTPVQRVKEAP